MPEDNILDESADDETVPPLPVTEDDDVLGAALVGGPDDLAVEDPLAAEDDDVVGVPAVDEEEDEDAA